MPRPSPPAALPAAAGLPRLMATDADLVLLVAPGGELLAAGDRVAEVLGWDLLLCAGEGVCLAVADAGERAALRQLLGEVLATGSARRTLQVQGAAGPLWLDIAAKQLTEEPGQPLHVVARDVSDDLAAAHQLAASELQWRLAFEHSPIGGALLDAAGDVLVVNQALCRMLGRREHELTRTDVHSLVVTRGGVPWQSWWDGVLHDPASTVTTDRMLRPADGSQTWGRLTAAAVPGAEPARVMLQIEDVTGRREAELELASQALHDGLTGAPNRFLTRQWLASALEDHPGGQVGVLYCDIDRFKVVNDSLGHGAGDSLLVQVAGRLRSALRPEDLIGRVGGDEFVIVVEAVGSAAELAEVAARLAASLDEPLELAGHRHTVSLSLGGTVGAHPDTADDVLVRADMALLRAKRLGRARYVAFDPGADRVTTREDLELEDDLRMSLASDELRAFYQPIVDLRSTSVVGHEALVRWEHPTRGLLPPERFLDLAESSGLIRPLGWWMLSQACHDAAQGKGGLASTGWVAVNASPSQLARPGVADDVTRALVESGLPPERLHLEITETALITASATLGDELRRLSEVGVRIALDDFGTGYSSLSLLREFPVDLVKIDRSFVEPVTSDRSALAIVKAVVSMCRDLGLPTVAEGIETPQQHDLLRELGCSHGQGFLFGRPVPLAVRVPVPARPLLPQQAGPSRSRRHV